MKSRGVGLIELIIASAIASALGLVLAVLFVHSRSIFYAESGKSGEMRTMSGAVRKLSGDFSDGSVYVIGPMDELTSAKGSTNLTVEEFLPLHHVHKIAAFAWKNFVLTEKDYPPATSLSPVIDFSKPESETVLASGVDGASFRLDGQNVLHVVLQSGGFALGADIPGLKTESAR